MFYDGLVVPGTLLLLFSGSWMTWEMWGGWSFTQHPWLAGMIILFAIAFVEGNTVTRLYFMRLRRLANQTMARGVVTPELKRARLEQMPNFTHFLDIPLLLVIVSLGAIRPATWTQFIISTVSAVAIAAALTWWIPRLHPWTPPTQPWNPEKEPFSISTPRRFLAWNPRSDPTVG